MTLWRYLKGRSGGAELEETPRRLTRNLSRDFGRHAPLPRTLVCLEVFDERGLISLEQHAGCLRISLQKVEGKVDLEQSAILQRLRQLMSG